MLHLHGISKSFGDVHVLRDVSYRFKPGCIYTLTGSNGSGKTTLFNLITGFLKPTHGTIRFKERDISGTTPWRINRFGIGRTFQDLRLATQMTVRENIQFALEKKLFALPDDAQKQRAAEILDQVSLTEKADELAGEISYGQQKLLTLGCCIANDADLLLIDEPVAGIDKTNFAKIVALVRHLKSLGKTILQIEHHPDYIRETSDCIVELQSGRLAVGYP